MDEQKRIEHIKAALGPESKGLKEPALMEVYRELAEWMLLYAIVVAGKSAKFAENAIKKFLLFRPDDEPPFQYIRRIGFNEVRVRAHLAGTGNYKRIVPAFIEVAGVEVFSWELEKLMEVKGIGPKTARFFLKWAFGQDQYAILDVHILKWLAYLGYEVPKQTPPNPRYLKIEQIFIEEADKRRMTPGSLDTIIWEYCSANNPRGDWPQILQRRE